MGFQLERTGTQHKPFYDSLFKPRQIFNVIIMATWLLLLTSIFPLLTYTTPNATVLGRFSTRYITGLFIYVGILLLWPLLLSLSERHVNRLTRSVLDLTSDARFYLAYIGICILLTFIVLTSIRFWGWGHIRLLQVNIVILGIWLSIVPTFWDLGMNSWKLRYVSPGRAYDWLTYNTHIWLPKVIVIGVLLISAYLGFKGKPQLSYLIIALVPGMLVLLAFLRWPPLGLIALIGTIIISKNGPSGFNASTALIALLLGLWILDMMVHRRDIRLVSSVPILPLLILLVVAVLAFGFGQLPWYTFAESAPLGAQLGGLAIYVLSAGAFLLVGHQIRDLRWLQALTWSFIAIGAVYMVDQLLRVHVVNSLYSEVINGSLFWTWLVTLAFSQAVFNQKLHLGWRGLLFGVVLATIYIAFFERNDWKSGWVPPLAGIAAMIAFRFWRLGLLLAPFGFLPVSIVSSYAISTDQYSYSTRVEAWLIVVEIAKANPVLGLGFANYNWFTPLFPIRGYAVRFNSHSQIVDIIAQTGLVGLAAFIWFFGAVGWLGWQLQNRVPNGFAKAYVYGALGGLVGTLVAALLGDWVLPFFYNVGLSGFRASMLSWVFLGGLVALDQMFLASNQVEETA